MIPQLVPPPDRHPQEGGTPYGYRLLVYLLQADHDRSVCLSDDQLSIARDAIGHCITMRNPIAVAGADRPDCTPVCVYDRLEDLRRQLSDAIARRQRLRDRQTAALQSLASVPPESHPSGGRLSPLLPPTPPLPPVGDALRQPNAPLPAARQPVADLF